MSYCVGHERHYIEADTNTTTTITDMSECSDRSVSFHFKPFQAMQDSIGTALRPQGGDFPTTLSNEFDALAPASRAMTVFFIIGTAFVIFSTFIRVAAHHFRRRFARYRIPDYKARPLPGHPDYSIRGNLETPPSYLELVTLMLSTMTLLIASIITSVVATKFITLIRASGDPNVSARHNHNFLGMAWSATIIQALLTVHKVASLVRYEDRHSPWDTEEYSLTRDTGNKALFTRLE
ncbi:hypothetical protein N7466_005791 [Penicillium verhagenii]|uniref:uncharacterized protein n=1 Tax=Penicillium verhagenii TaxID=1562060 RepID=UPI0025452A6E|nr:uncharacterized protein N7466_005791 [Penicillium verhagenii]KAJ5930298.1 hypothetical protein N7466_005791 [Penicillium verhagenii]